MRVFIRRRTVRGPARMTNADSSRNRALGQQPRQTFVDLPLFLARLDGVILQDRNARAVVAAIFEPTQTFQNNSGSLSFTNVANNAAHDDLDIPTYCPLKRNGLTVALSASRVQNSFCSRGEPSFISAAQVLA